MARPSLVVVLLLVCPPVFAGGRAPGSADQEAPAVPLTTEKVRKVTDVLRNFNQKIKADPRLAREIYGTPEPSGDKHDSGFSIDPRIEKHPVFQKALAAAGVGAGAFRQICASILEAEFATAARAGGERMSLPKITTANMTWVQQHHAEVQRFGDQMKENARLSENAESASQSADEDGKVPKEK
jgi:hypothetical protein